VIGDILVLASSACFAVFAVAGKDATKSLASPLLVSGVSTVGGAAALALPAWWETGGQLPRPDLLGWAMVGYLGIVVTCVGMLGWFWALRIIPASRAAAFLFVQPLSGVALSAALLREQLSPSFLLGTALVLGALSLISDS
jgi:drug/metabolite transporter (DMT)-like permease